MPVEQDSVTTQEPDTILLEPQLTQGQNLFVPREGEERGTFYGLLRRSSFPTRPTIQATHPVGV